MKQDFVEVDIAQTKKPAAKRPDSDRFTAPSKN